MTGMMEIVLAKLDLTEPQRSQRSGPVRKLEGQRRLAKAQLTEEAGRVFVSGGVLGSAKIVDGKEGEARCRSRLVDAVTAKGEGAYWGRVPGVRLTTSPLQANFAGLLLAPILRSRAVSTEEIEGSRYARLAFFGTPELNLQPARPCLGSGLLSQEE